MRITKVHKHFKMSLRDIRVKPKLTEDLYEQIFKTPKATISTFHHLSMFGCKGKQFPLNDFKMREKSSASKTCFK